MRRGLGETPMTFLNVVLVCAIPVAGMAQPIESLALSGRFGSHAVAAFGLQSTLHENLRYFRSGSVVFWPRTAHALPARMDSRGDTLSAWYPNRLNIWRLGTLRGSLRFGFDSAGNLRSQFWPDFTRKVLRPAP
jgi:hypothetical protein